MVMMPQPLPEVTDPEQRAHLARWAVSLRRAHTAGTAQGNGSLAAARSDDLDVVGYCCLGVWCEIATAGGTLERYPSHYSRQIGYGEPGSIPDTSTLPSGAWLASSDNPDLLRVLSAETWAHADLAVRAGVQGNYNDLDDFLETEAETLCAADLNDELGLNFGQIADVVVWRYQLTPEELAAAEQEPRVPWVEGPEILPF